MGRADRVLPGGASAWWCSWWRALGGGVGTAGRRALAAALAFVPLRRRLQRASTAASTATARAGERGRRLRRPDHTGGARARGYRASAARGPGRPGLRLLVWLPGRGLRRPRRRPRGGRRRAGTAVTAVGRGDWRWWSTPTCRAARAAGRRPARRRPVEVARLRGELRRRLDEVEESRGPDRRAGYEERRRLERDLHDGAQQRLVALGMALRRVQRRWRGDAEARAARRRG